MWELSIKPRVEPLVEQPGLSPGLDGETSLSFTEDVGARFEGYGWQVLEVKNGDTDVDAIRDCIAKAKACTDKPTLIKVKTVIGYGSPNKANSHDAHGAPLGSPSGELTAANFKGPIAGSPHQPHKGIIQTVT